MSSRIVSIQAARAILAGVALAWIGGQMPAMALDEIANEKENLKACEKRICEMVVRKEASGADLACALSKTWGKDKIKEGIEKKRISWGFGDAQCVLDLAVPRGMIHASLTKPEHTLDFPSHTIRCKVERDKDVTPISITMAPKVSFKNGKAVKAIIGVKEIEAPAVVKGALWTVATVEDTVGLFHGDIIGEINEFIEKKCPKAMAAGG